MDAAPLPPPIWVAEPHVLNEMLAVLHTQPMIGVDTESNSLYAYQERVCLIQFSTPDHDYLVDPIAIKDLQPLGQIFAAKTIEKIFHAAEYDIICLKRDFNFSFNNIFDTMYAARILGKGEVGLSDMLKSELGVIIEKRFQRANWGERPLPPAMLAYARIDSHYLIELHNHLHQQLEEKGLLDLAREDFYRLTQVPVTAPENDAQNYWKLIGRNKLSVQQCAVLQALIEYRDRQAWRANLPHFKILGNQTLIDIARACPLTLDELTRAARLSPRQLERYASGLLQAVSQGLTSRPPARPSNHRPDDDVLARIDALKNWRKLTARELKVESDVVLPREYVERIASANPTSLAELKTLMKPTPWRFQKYGQGILDVLSKSEES